MTPRDRTKYNWRLAFLVWLTLLTIATHLPQSEITKPPTIESPDKLLHMVCFGTLAFLFMCCGWVKNKWLVWIAVAGWAGIDEATQNMIPLGREFSFNDVIAGQIGIGCAIAWMGSLHTPVTTKILVAVELVLARAQHWFVLGAIAVVSTIVPCVVLGLAFSLTFGYQINGFVLLVGILTATLNVLYCLVKIGGIESEISQLRKNMATTLFATIVIATMVGFSISHTFFDPWVAMLACLVIGCRVAWGRSIRHLIETQDG